MNTERLPDLLLNGKLLHCRPIEGGPIIEAQIIPSEEELTPTFKKAIICPVRMPHSKCGLRIIYESKGRRCQYYKGDSCGAYQIIGPEMDKKSGRD